VSRIHVIGAGMAGLACALRAALAGAPVALYEAAGHAGGRCRSFRDKSIGRVVDNGSHLLLGAYRSTLAFLDDIGARERITEIAPAAFPFVDLKTGERWIVRPEGGRLPLWLLDARRRIPGTRLTDYLGVLSLARAGAADTVAARVASRRVLFERFWQPLTRAALNTDATEASARLLWNVVAETFMKGEAACRPMLFLHGLSAALVDPAIRTLQRSGGEVRFLARLRGIEWRADRVTGLQFAEGLMRIGTDDVVVLAVPPDAAAELWPAVPVPSESRAIVNVHFRVDEPVELPWRSPFVGLIGADSEWIFAREGVLSVTISAADRFIETPSHELAGHLWGEVAHVLGRTTGRLPPWRIIKEKRATFAQTPAEATRRPAAATTVPNLFLAGDWTDTGLPATIEGAIRSGFAAASLALDRAARAPALRRTAG